MNSSKAYNREPSNKPRVLKLSLYKAAFDVMVTGEKAVEYRIPSKWILSRIVDKEYDLVLFTNGYGADKPYFVAKWLGWDTVESKTNATITYSNGLKVEVEKGMVMIFLGEVVETGNLRS